MQLSFFMLDKLPTMLAEFIYWYLNIGMKNVRNMHIYAIKHKKYFLQTFAEMKLIANFTIVIKSIL